VQNVQQHAQRRINMPHGEGQIIDGKKLGVMQSEMVK
jgi:hypothetical protein